MLRRVVHLKAAMRSAWSGTKVSQSVNSRCVPGEVNVGKVPERPGEVLPGAAVGDLDVAPGEQRRMDHGHVCRPVAPVLMVVSGQEHGRTNHFSGVGVLG